MDKIHIGKFMICTFMSSSTLRHPKTVGIKMLT